MGACLYKYEVHSIYVMFGSINMHIVTIVGLCGCISGMCVVNTVGGCINMICPVNKLFEICRVQWRLYDCVYECMSMHACVY